MKVTIIKGVEGLAVYVNDYRIAGSKPWGGGTVVREWTVDEQTLKTAMAQPIPAEKTPKVKR